eukprot:CAMPEP_0195587754 /NCGR_PEP_ID=MMETSP0814-20130614/31495_1 /TAXON_ID=97485 /ORGANISM="Prymnesium parvum, Strain Texoma1" /LENGTH=80 /DNA_ID=CAMNT_0040726595 /DNA_START=953 /DNA_END=1191 /DNA_ORIENTATION=+
MKLGADVTSIQLKGIDGADAHGGDDSSFHECQSDKRLEAKEDDGARKCDEATPKEPEGALVLLLHMSDRSIEAALRATQR